MAKNHSEKPKRNENNNIKGKSINDDGGSNEVGKGLFHINRDLVPLKITLFLFFGGMAAILPYLTIHMRDIGISLTEIGIIYAVLPFTAFLGPPIMGFMADSFGQYKKVLILATIVTSLAHTSLLFVPRYSEKLVYSSAVIVFGGEGGAELQPVSSNLCGGFEKSLRFHGGGGNLLRNQIINVTTCNEIRDTLTITRRIPGPELDLLPISSIPQTFFLSYPEEPRENKPFSLGGRSLGQTPCSVQVRINSVDTGGKTFPSITCQTNYTFATGAKITQGNGQLTFWLYLLLRIIGNLFMATCFSMLDATTLAVVGKNRDQGAEYGKERIIVVLATALISPLAGLLVDQMSQLKGYTDYSSSFYLSNVMLFLNVLGYFFMRLEVEKPTEDIWKNATALLNYPEVVVFLGMIFVLGNMWGFVESYLYIFLDELHAPKYLLGLTFTVGNLSSIPVLFLAGRIVEKVGRVNIIVLAFLIYCIRFVGYSYIPNPFWCFPFEVLEAFTYQLMWVAAATYCAVLAPKGLLATLTGVMGSLHYGLGKGSGAFIGGYLINMSSTRASFRYFGGASAIVGLIYFGINRCWLDGAIRKRNEREKTASQSQAEEQKEAMLPPLPLPPPPNSFHTDV